MNKQFLQPTHIGIYDRLMQCLQKLGHPCCRLIFWDVIHLNHAEALHCSDQALSLGYLQPVQDSAFRCTITASLASVPTLLRGAT